MPLQGPHLQNNQGTVKIIMSYILHLQFQCIGQLTFMYCILSLSLYVYITTFHRPNLLILSNNTNIKKT
jgi:hypothetical protein